MKCAAFYHATTPLHVRHPRSRSSRGLSIVEIAVTIVVISILVLVLFQSLAAMIITADAELIQSAAHGLAEGELAAALLEDYNSASLAVTQPNAPRKVNTTPINVTFTENGEAYTISFGVEREIVEDTSRGAGKEFKKITVRVFWPDDGGAASGEVVVMSILSR